MLVGLARGADLEVATNAAGALARIARRNSERKVVTGAAASAGTATKQGAIAEAACAMLADGRATVRANALATLANLGARCGDGHIERKLLADDPSDLVRGDAARALVAAPVPEDRAALDRCAAADRSAEVARLCRPRIASSEGARRAQAVTVFIVGESSASAPRPRAPYLIQYEDGVLRAGVADRRGAMFDPAAPAGEVVLRRPPTP
jgi:hypothetical protein